MGAELLLESNPSMLIEYISLGFIQAMFIFASVLKIYTFDFFFFFLKNFEGIGTSKMKTLYA